MGSTGGKVAAGDSPDSGVAVNEAAGDAELMGRVLRGRYLFACDFSLPPTRGISEAVGEGENFVAGETELAGEDVAVGCEADADGVGDVVTSSDLEGDGVDRGLDPGISRLPGLVPGVVAPGVVSRGFDGEDVGVGVCASGSALRPAVVTGGEPAAGDWLARGEAAVDAAVGCVGLTNVRGGASGGGVDSLRIFSRAFAAAC